MKYPSKTKHLSKLNWTYKINKRKICLYIWKSLIANYQARHHGKKKKKLTSLSTWDIGDPWETPALSVSVSDWRGTSTSTIFSPPTTAVSLVLSAAGVMFDWNGWNVPLSFPVEVGSASLEIDIVVASLFLDREAWQWNVGGLEASVLSVSWTSGACRVTSPLGRPFKELGSEVLLKLPSKISLTNDAAFYR